MKTRNKELEMDIKLEDCNQRAVVTYESETCGGSRAVVCKDSEDDETLIKRAKEIIAEWGASEEMIEECEWVVANRFPWSWTYD